VGLRSHLTWPLRCTAGQNLTFEDDRKCQPIGHFVLKRDQISSSFFFLTLLSFWPDSSSNSFKPLVTGLSAKFSSPYTGGATSSIDPSM